MTRIATFLKGLIRRVKKHMKEFSIGLTMTFIAAAFALLLESLHTSNQITAIALDLAGIISFVTAVWLWNYTVKQIREKELQEKNDRDNLIKATNGLAGKMDNVVNKINDLVSEIRKDRAERNK
jgi:uncharacterized membrane protein